MSLLAFAFFYAGLCWSQSDPPSSPTPRIELQAREVDGVDLLRVLAELAPVNFVAVRDGQRARVDIPPHAAPIEEMWSDVTARSGMQRVVRNGYEIVVNACRLPLASEPVPDAAPGKDDLLTLHFNRISTDLFFALMAQALKLQLNAPEGLPESDLALLIRARPASEILASVDSVLALETRIDRRQLVVRKRSGPRACLTAGRETWQASLPKPDALERSLNELLKATSHHNDQPCRRVVDFPDTATRRCVYLEYFPLAKLVARGYIRLTPMSPIGALMEDSAEPFLYRVYQGDLVGDRAGVVGWVDTRKVEIVERWKSEHTSVQDLLTTTWFQTVGSTTLEVPERYGDTVRENHRQYDDLERYDLEDLLIRSTQDVQGKWQAAVVDPFGLVHTTYINDYVGMHWGRITKITPTEIQLEEIVPDNLGGYMTRNVVIVPGVRYEEPRKAIKRKYDAPIQDTGAQRAFIGAASLGDLRQLERFMDLGANIDAAGDGEHDNALVAAIYQRRASTVAWLLAKGAKANICVGPSEQTPLHVAASMGDLKVAEQLITAGADVNLRDAHGRTPIERALWEDHGSIVTLLVSKGTDLKTWNEIGLTPFTLAAYYGRIDAVRLFLDNGVTIADRDRGGYTLLAAAVQGRNKKEFVATLIDLGSDVNALSKSGESVLDLAQAKKAAPAIVDLLTTHGARSAQPRPAAPANP
jgi:ankyrin repeat protein/Tfp pilus assembly protein PilP